MFQKGPEEKTLDYVVVPLDHNRKMGNNEQQFTLLLVVAKRRMRKAR